PASQESWLISPACSAVLVGAHYRDGCRAGKGFFTIKVRSFSYPTKWVKHGHFGPSSHCPWF
ncbi:hypothetical protein, partial [Aeromonas molluscorum]